MFTFTDGIILRGLNLEPVKANVTVDDGIITDISKDTKEGKLIDVDGAIIVPSFFNGHTHIGDSIIKDEGYGLSLGEMVKPPNGVKHRALASAKDSDIIESMKSSMLDMLESGITHFIDYREGGIKGVKLLKEASKDIPIKPIILGRDDSFYGDDPDLAKVKSQIRKLLKIADGIAPSGFGEITDEVANLIVEECNKAGKISSIHVAESESTQIESLERFGKTEIERGVQSNFNQLVHCTNAKNNDLELIKNSNANVVVCPRANATLNVGIAPLNEMLDLGIKPILGTDNLMLNSPDMFRELEFALKIMSVNYNSYLNPCELLKMATTNACLFDFDKSYIEIGQVAEFNVIKHFSKNPYLSIINRSQTKNILYTINKIIK
ncbi:MAG: amidohydrolase family protein [Methanobrevibacter sp.]|uniref:Chlorohydrolase n=1 Tax=Methanobrevibacter millerae TaxID=230361 RepID=A0A8T3VCN7_9EURY|nr:amidohydrolase family protein [Methanobrevibacter millerae]MBE6504902.1 chlorohydrolase [Methanobrevibacter millerae]MBR0370720.1 amidohydrolase family protein [Methanobrevibacter sp.]